MIILVFSSYGSPEIGVPLNILCMCDEFKDVRKTSDLGFALLYEKMLEKNYEQFELKGLM